MVIWILRAANYSERSGYFSLATCEDGLFTYFFSLRASMGHWRGEWARDATEIACSIGEDMPGVHSKCVWANALRANGQVHTTCDCVHDHRLEASDRKKVATCRLMDKRNCLKSAMIKQVGTNGGSKTSSLAIRRGYSSKLHRRLTQPLDGAMPLAHSLVNAGERHTCRLSHNKQELVWPVTSTVVCSLATMQINTHSFDCSIFILARELNQHITT